MRRLLSLLICCALLAMAGTASVTPDSAWALVEAASEAQHRADGAEAEPDLPPEPPAPAQPRTAGKGKGLQPRQGAAARHRRRPFQPRAPPRGPMHCA